MPESQITTREPLPSDIEKIVDYFVKADKDYLLALGADVSKLPERDQWIQLITEDKKQPIASKKFFYVVCLLDGEAIGHSNINRIIFGKEAWMHLHLWDAANRQKGTGLEFLKQCIPQYFETFNLETLYCEPYANNPAPNKTLAKLGFDFIKEYETIPGWINFYQRVKSWKLDADKYRLLYKNSLTSDH